MQDDPQWLLWVAGLAVWASLATWTIAVSRWRRGLVVVPYTPRRRVPWGGLHLLLVVLVYVGLLATMGTLAAHFLPAEMTRTPAIRDLDQSNTTHPAARLLAEADPAMLLVCGLAVVVVAPIVEELFFRVLLQGWFEASQRRIRRRMPTLRRWMPGASGPILLTAFLFAGMHFRVETPPMSPSYLTLMLVVDSVAKLLTAAFAVVLLRTSAGATATDLGWGREKFFSDVGLGLVAFAAMAAPVYALMIGLGRLLPAYLAPDPFVLFPFAIVLGILYYRTHRIVPSVMLHMALNATSVAMALLALKKVGG